MKDQIHIVSTKKLSEKQKQTLLTANFSVFDEDFIAIQNKDFDIDKTNDYLIFTSQSAVESVLRNKQVADIRIKKCFCVGENTKAFFYSDIRFLFISKNTFYSILTCKN